MHGTGQWAFYLAPLVSRAWLFIPPAISYLVGPIEQCCV